MIQRKKKPANKPTFSLNLVSSAASYKNFEWGIQKWVFQIGLLGTNSGAWKPEFTTVFLTSEELWK